MTQRIWTEDEKGLLIKIYPTASEEMLAYHFPNRSTEAIRTKAYTWGIKRKYANQLEKIERYIMPEPNSGCWLWSGASTRGGYGVINKMRAHRFVWEILVGPVPAGMCVLHKCDNPACVKADSNPFKSHLFLGTCADNNRDCAQKRRYRYGEQHPQHKLTEQQVAQIKSDPRGSVTLGRVFGVWKNAIENIKSGKTWKHVISA